MKVLIIGQLPKEAGGNYTTGIARVVENLYKKNFDGLEMFWYFTNVPNKKMVLESQYKKQYNGYEILPVNMAIDFLKHPIRNLKEWRHYRAYDKVNPLRYHFYKVNFEQVIKKTKPDLIHLHGGGLAPLYYANRNFATKILLTFHGVMYNEEDKNSWHYKPLYLENIKMADYFTVLNQETKRKALNLGMPEEKCFTIPNGVDTSRFVFSIEERERIRKELKAKDNDIVFITTGGVIDRKGQYDFLQVLNTLKINFQYWIVGEGVDSSKIEEYASKHGISDRVKLLGYIDGRELYKYLSGADIYAHVSTTEGQALSEIEAYATGLRVIVRKEIERTVIGDPQNDSLNYCVLDFNSVQKENLKKWLNINTEVRESRDKYDWSEIASRYAELYKQLLK